MGRCVLCEKSAVSGSQVSHSQIHTKRRFKPNLQKVNGMILCTRCLKTIKKVEAEVAVAPTAETKTEVEA
jgi:large subunit ribosomal protein L28